MVCFGMHAKAQQLILNPEFRTLKFDSNNNNAQECRFHYNDSEFNALNYNSHIKAFTFGEKGYDWALFYFGFRSLPSYVYLSLGTINMFPFLDTLINPNIFSVMKIPHGYGFPSSYPYQASLPAGLNSAIGRISMDLAQKTIPNTLYFLRFYASIYHRVITSSPAPYYFPGIFSSSSSLRIGLSSVDSLFGNQILTVIPPIVNSCVTYSTPQKYTTIFKATDSANYLTLMGDYDTSVFTIYQFRSFALYPALMLGKHNAYMCVGDSLKLISSIHGNKYDWTPPTGIACMVDSVPYYMANDTGWYVNYIYRTDSVLVDSIHVMYKQIIINTTKDTLICQGTSTVLRSANTLIGNKYLWSTADTVSLIHVNNSGVFWVATTNNSNCTKVDSFNVQVQPKTPLPLPSDTLFCKAGNYLLNAYNNAYNKYLWNTLDTTPSIIITNAGKYFVTASNNICKITDTITIQILNFPQLKINDTSFCSGGSIVLNASNVNYTKYLWSTNDTTSYITVHDSGTYIITASNSVCKTIDTIHVSIYSNPALHLVQDTVLCEGNILTINAKNSSYNTYLWNTGEITPQIKVTQSGKYIVTASIGICKIKDSTTLKLYSLPHLNLPKDTIVCLSQLGAVILNAGKFKTYYWYPTGERSQTIAAVNPEIYMVVVTDSNNCIGSDTTLIDDNCPYQLYMPNAFTPTNDLLNESFKGYGMGIAQFEMHIYNRWGEELFSTTDINKGWDGTFKNNTCMADSYVWQVTYRLKNESTLRTDKGTVTLLK